MLPPLRGNDVFRMWWYEIPDVVSRRVSSPSEANRTVAVEELLKESTTGQPHPATSIHTPVCIQQQFLKHLQEHRTRLQGALLPCLIRSIYLFITWETTGFRLNEKTDSPTFMPLSQLIHKSPLVRKQATACRARWWIQPSCLNWVIMASIQGKPVRPSAHLASASGFWSHGIWKQTCYIVSNCV